MSQTLPIFEGNVLPSFLEAESEPSEQSRVAACLETPRSSGVINYKPILNCNGM
jgi:hypothetical protein